ncbi:MAG: hypothetical protein HC896_00875 [Bacteroidales bacterium]|nr:hypothetical protein [Bacteroidales bacterium]
MIVISILAVVVAMVVALVISSDTMNILGGRIKDITEVVRRVASGDININFKSASAQTGLMRDMEFMVANLKSSVNVAIEVAEGNISNAEEMVQKLGSGDLDLALKTMVQSLKESISVARSISAGDLMVNITKTGDLDLALKEMTERLNNIVDNILASAENIASSSQQLSNGSQQLSQGSTEQASSTEEVSASMEQMASNIQQNTDNARQTEKIAKSASERMIKVQSSASESLSSIKSISEKIQIINDIAYQTNILALNAAVEAARAGEHGKGFAVVAAEVRKLAERRKISADQIISLAKSSVEVTNEANSLLGELIPEINKTSMLVQEITAASIEQNAGADQVNNAILQLNTVTQSNAAAAEELATSSEEMAGQAEILKSSIAYFRTNAAAKESGFRKPAKTAHKYDKHSDVKAAATIKLDDDPGKDNDFVRY